MERAEDLSNDCKHLAFSIRQDQEDDGGSKLRVWIIDMETGKAKPLFHSPDVFLNAVFDNYVWVNDLTLLVCTIPSSRGSPPEKPLVPLSPKIQSNERKSVVQARTYQDLLKDEYDEGLFEYYAMSQLVLVSLDGTVKLFGEPSIYTSLHPSPDQKYVLLHSVHRPFSFNVPCCIFPEKIDLWSADGKCLRTLCDLPVAEDIPIAFNSVRKSTRSLKWRADKPSDLYWVETQDGGDAKVEVSPRDIVYTQAADAPEGEEPTIFFKLDLRYGGISWCDDSLALVYESWYKTRHVRTWLVAPGSHETPRLLFDRSSEDVYSDPGSPMLWTTPAGTNVIAKFKKEDKEGTYLLLNGSGATPEGNIPFLDLFEIDTGDKERVWQSDKEKYYESVVALLADRTAGDLNVDELKVLISKESKTESSQYYIQQLPNRKACQITCFPHPYPHLASLHKEMVRYERRDGVQLTATLYLPPGYNPSHSMAHYLVWFGLILVILRIKKQRVKFVIFFGPTIPIIGEGKEEANDSSFVEQLVWSAEAAVEEVIRRGVAHPDKIAIGGHSYGAFMTANLLAHAPHLFSCGIACPGAYNRTLTPFGFQNEDRTLWEATDTYIKMSPFMFANKIKKPILLIHGEEDNNAGTLTMQVRSI
ncbi:hypothetical protein L1987_76762 [Smallanthus sonchifolius]|uniref:Uncharacterized protein n=1 Tax=Smallanthus sonchifolius TaxID=185202 RepID=A0ACB8Z957_9ASTR|nr:hypothetical protein L1987_76762 [Smallanthus sonchifolius]